MTKVVLFGDSLTAGVIDGHPSPIFTRLLEDKFPDVEFINRGLPGDQTRNACKRLRQLRVKILSRSRKDVMHYSWK